MADLNENNDNIEIKGNEDSAPSERVRKMKQKLERLVMKMKQPDEEELNEEELINPFAVSRREDKKEEKKDRPEFEIKDIFADTDGSEPDIFDADEEKEEKKVELVEKKKAKELFEKLPEYNIFDDKAKESAIKAYEMTFNIANRTKDKLEKKSEEKPSLIQ